MLLVGYCFGIRSERRLCDEVENAIIVDVEATTAIRQAEVLAAKRMIERSLERFDLYPSRLLGDSGYGSAEMLGWLLYEHDRAARYSARQVGSHRRDLLARVFHL